MNPTDYTTTPNGPKSISVISNRRNYFKVWKSYFSMDGIQKWLNDLFVVNRLVNKPLGYSLERGVDRKKVALNNPSN